MARHQDSSDILLRWRPLEKIVKTLSVSCLCGHAEWSSWLMRRSAVSAWTERQTSFCPAHTASVRSALINGKVMDQKFILIILFVTKIKRFSPPWHEPTLNCHCYTLVFCFCRSGQSRNCPICRLQVTAAKESWVLSDFPTEDDIAGYILNLADDAGHPHRP